VIGKGGVRIRKAVQTQKTVSPLLEEETIIVRTITLLGGVSEFERIEIERTRREGSSMHKRLGSMYDGSSARYTSVFERWQ